MSFYSLDTQFSADSVEFCPDANVFAIGTYQVDESQSSFKRRGKIILLTENINDSTANVVSTFNTNAILDMKWNKRILATADSKGFVQIYALSSDEKSLTESTSKQVGTTDGDAETPPLCLSLDWKNTSELVVSQSDGSFSLATVTSDSIQIKDTAKAHDYECWISVFSKTQPHVVYTGGDDLKFKCWDIRSLNSGPTSTNSKTHGAGVTSIYSCSKTNRLYTGSYDDNLRIWDERNLSTPLETYSVGGGLWRILPNPSDPDLILLAAMYNGFHVVKIQNNSVVPVIEFKEHSSIAYGIGWSYTTKMIGTCSFYDHLFKLWNI